MARQTFFFDIDGYASLPRLKVRAASQTYDDADNDTRVLFVTDYVPFSDINDMEEGKTAVLFSNEEGEVFSNLIRYSSRKAKDIKELVVFNWHNVHDAAIDKSQFDSKRTQKSYAHEYSNKRLLAFIKKMKPDVVMFSGMEAFESFCSEYLRSQFPKKVNFKNKFNRLIDVDIKGHNCQIIGTMDVRRAASQNQEDIKKYPNLMGFIITALEAVRNRKNRYNISLPKGIKYINLDTVEKFDRFYKKLIKEKIVSIDSESKNLKRIANVCYSIQFAFNSNIKKSYFLPIDHPDTPFSANDLSYIKDRLRKYFEKNSARLHLFMNGKFDLQQFMTQLGVRFFCAPVYDIMAGEYTLDENRKLLAKRGGANVVEKPFSLDAIAEYYGCDIYSRIAFSKGDRADMSVVKLDKKFIQYSCIDTIVPLLVMQCQLREATRRGHKQAKRFILKVISNTIHAISQLEHTGATIDKKYLFSLLLNDSDIDKQIKGALGKINQSPEVKKANRILLEKKEIPRGFEEPFIFKINKEEHRQVLFFEVMKLVPLAFTKKATGKIDKAFKEKYKDIPIIKQLATLEKLKKLYTTYVKGFFSKLTRDIDCRDGSIRSNYQWNEITTGRLGSNDPNLQNIVARGEEAKTIKRCFTEKFGIIQIKNDYSAHEVREWANLAGIKALADAFDRGLLMRRKLRVLMEKYPEEAEAWRQHKFTVKWGEKEKKDSSGKVISPAGVITYKDKQRVIKRLNNPNTKKIAALELEIEVFGDIHKLNVQRFFGTPVLEVTDEQRYNVKAVVFGTLYGKGAAGLAESLGITEEEAQTLIDSMFREFPEGKEWIDDLIRSAQRDFNVLSPSGMIRHLWAYLHNKKGVRNAMDRRGPNAVIQGLASQQGVDSMRNMQTLVWDYLINNDIETMWKILTNYVHDSVESRNFIHLLPIHLYLLEHASTTLVHNNYTDIHHMNFLVGMEVEFQVGASMDKLYTWKWGSAELREYAEKVLDWQAEYYGVKNYPVIKKRIMSAFDKNMKIITKVRAKELQKLCGKPNEIERKMLLQPKHMHSLGFQFDVEGLTHKYLKEHGQLRPKKVVRNDNRI
jgi:DNA polymerase I-like protein with 3'-5' exonuclease and polymerase domains